jgi:sulfite exporter TauE/SafE
MTDQNALLAVLSAGLVHCEVILQTHGSLLLSLFMTGLLGGPTHCSGMCGPFVLSQITARMEATPTTRMREWQRYSNGLLLPYHLGRMTTYILLGLALSMLTSSAGTVANLKWVSFAFMLLAAIMFVGYAIPQLRLQLPGVKFLESAYSKTVTRHCKGLFARPTGVRGYGLGVLLGLLPCGLLYAAVAAAAAAGDLLLAAMGMACFALGTAVPLWGIGFLGHWASQKYKQLIPQVAPMLMLVNALVLIYLAIEMVWL